MRLALSLIRGARTENLERLARSLGMPVEPPSRDGPDSIVARSPLYHMRLARSVHLELERRRAEDASPTWAKGPARMLTFEELIEAAEGR